MRDSILKIEGLCINAAQDGHDVALVNDINIEIKRNSICCIVGNSGSGKSLVATSIISIFADNLRVSGAIYFNGVDLLSLPPKELDKIRGKQIGIVVQNCAGALNPLLKNGKQLRLVMKKYHKGNEKQKAIEVLRRVELGEPGKILNQYPHELSGGMKQRLLTAIGMVNAPDLLIMDEPTKGMDVILRNQIAAMIEKVYKETDTTILLITHDLELAYKLSDYCYVMSRGSIVEENNTKLLFNHSNSSVFKELLNSEQKMSSFFRGVGTQDARA